MIFYIFFIKNLCYFYKWCIIIKGDYSVNNNERNFAMALDYINIEASSDPDKVKQNLKFKTGKFVWKVKFTAPLNPATVNSSNLYVVNSSGDKIKAIITYDEVSNCIEIEPLPVSGST